MAFTERDIRADVTALEELKRLGADATPVIVVDGEVVVGFDPTRLGALLKPSTEAQ